MTWTLIITILLLAIVQGAIVGLLPGLPAMIGLIVLLPLFVKLPVEAILLFFSCYICVTQYFGSVSALLFRIPGESSSLPALEAGKKLKLFTSIAKAYRATALTSFVASLVGIALFLVIFFVFQHYWPYIFSVKFTVMFLTALLVLLIVQNKHYIFNTVLIASGILLSQNSDFIVLHKLCTATDWFCFLRSPMDNNLVLISLFSVPLLFYKLHDDVVPVSTNSSYLPSWRSILPVYKKGISHGFLGFIVGFTPGAGLTLASNLSASLERQKNPYKYLSYASAAEAANNSAAISCIIPFLFLGLPITPSELIIDQFLTTKFYRLNLDTLNHAINIGGEIFSFVTILIAGILICNLACFIMCGNFIRMWRRLLAIDVRWYLLAVKLLVVASIIAIIYTAHISLASAVFNILLFGSIGLWAVHTNRSVLGLAVAMMLGPFIIDKFTMAYYLYF
jgi:putative tricarboxylic transport membrane protein